MKLKKNANIVDKYDIKFKDPVCNVKLSMLLITEGAGKILLRQQLCEAVR